MASITVVGSANLDIVVPVPHHPRTGETVLGGDHELIAGGKGANQAVAAARLGAEVSFIGMIGDDSAGAILQRSLATSNVDTTGLSRTSDAPSGIALITVDSDGDNAIVVSPGSNALVTPALVDQHMSLLDADVVQLQLEIPLETVTYVARHARGTVLLDPAPAPAGGLSAELLDAVDVLVPNETELALLAGRNVDPEDVEAVAAAARSLGVETVVVTLGSKGAVIVTPKLVEHVQAPTIEPVDSTAAGDSFRSALAVRLADGSPIIEAVEFAVRVGAATTLAFGAQTSLPTSEQVEERLR